MAALGLALLGGLVDELLRPGFVWWAAAALLPLVLAFVIGARRRAMLARLAEPRHLARLFPSLARRAGAGKDLGRWLARRGRVRALLAAATVLLLVAALLGPVRGFALVPVATRQVDVVVCLDTSRSMLVEDIEPTRLARAKNEVAALFDAMRGERVGLVAFAGLARMVAPLTKDVDTARFFLERLSPEDNRKGGTDIGAALRLALERLDGDAGSNQAIIVVTDGEDLSGEGLDAAEEAKERGVVVHVLGLGTASGGKVPDGLGGFVVDEGEGGSGEEVVSKLESSTLRALSDATGGIYLEAKGRVLPLEELYRRAIATMEGRDLVDGKERVPRDRYQWPLLLALLALVIEGALRDTRMRTKS